MTVDPGKLNLKHLINPQKWNKYVYVLNNPLSSIDPDGREEVKITITSFIPFKTTSILGRTFAGDNRGFSPTADSFRTRTKIVVETDPKVKAKPLVSVRSEIGETIKLDASGKALQRGFAMGTAAVYAERDQFGNTVVSFSENTKNPLSPVPQALTLGIRSNLTISIKEDASIVTVVGTISEFPAFEIFVTHEGSSTTQVLGQMPPSNKAFRLAIDIPVVLVKPLPPPPPKKEKIDR